MTLLQSAQFIRYSRYFWTLLLVGAGMSHFVLSDFLVAQMPPYFEKPDFWVYVSGAAELLLTLGLQLPRWRAITWWLIAAMCATYLPVHWYVASECVALADTNGSYHIPCWLGWLRLPIQVAFTGWTVWLARKAGGNPS